MKTDQKLENMLKSLLSLLLSLIILFGSTGISVYKHTCQLFNQTETTFFQPESCCESTNDKDIVKKLKDLNIDTRPVFPSISQYPYWTKKQIEQPNSKLISDRALWVWVVAFASPFIFNYVIFSPTLYGDQYIYTFEVVELAFDRQRIPGSNLWGGYNSTGYMAGYLLSFVPIPALATLTSLAFANRIIAFIFYIWLSRLEYVSEKAALALCLIPSFILYTSLSLREALILIPATVILLSYLRGKYLPMLIMLPILYILKFQVFPN